MIKHKKRKAFEAVKLYHLPANISLFKIDAANVQLLPIHLAMAIGGKGYVTMTGDMATVTAAVEAGANFIRRKGLLVNKVVIPQPRPEFLEDKI